MRAIHLLALSTLANIVLPAGAEEPAQSAPMEFYLQAPDDPDGDGFAPRSVPRRTAGQVLVVLSGLSALGSFAIGTSQECSPFGCYVHWLFTIPLAVQGGVLGAIGVPLWVTGAEEVPIPWEEDEAVGPSVRPEIHVGAGALGLGLTF